MSHYFCKVSSFPPLHVISWGKRKSMRPGDISLRGAHLADSSFWLLVSDDWTSSWSVRTSWTEYLDINTGGRFSCLVCCEPVWPQALLCWSHFALSLLCSWCGFCKLILKLFFFQCPLTKGDRRDDVSLRGHRSYTACKPFSRVCMLIALTIPLLYYLRCVGLCGLFIMHEPRLNEFIAHQVLAETLWHAAVSCCA